MLRKLRPVQWAGIVVAVFGLAAVGWSVVPRSHAIPSVRLEELGLSPDHAEKAIAVAESMPVFRLVGAAATEDNTHKNVRLWDAMLQLRGGVHFPNVPQEIGDCVSWGAANAVNYLQAIQLARDQSSNEEFHPAFPPWIYGTSRIWVGRKHGSRFNGDGSVGAYAAEALHDYGCLRADHEKVPPYSGSLARQWGSSGPPEWSRDIAKPFLIQTTSPVRTSAEARDAICNGYPVTIASGWWGTDNIPVVDGRRVAKRTTSWGHQQCLIGYDGATGKEPYFYVLNSWGPNAHPAPMQNEPPGGYWIRAKDVDHICSEGDSWAFSSFQGFPAEGINWDDLLRRPVTSSAPPVGGAGNGGHGIMFANSTMVGVSGLVVCLLGVGLFACAGRRFRQGVGLAGAICLGVACLSVSTMAQDFGIASKRENAVQAVQQSGDHLGWVGAMSRAAPEVPALEWAPAAQRQPAAASAIQKPKGKKQALYFTRTANCSACLKGNGYINSVLVPMGWKAGDSPDADFRIIDVQKPGHEDLQQKYNVEAVPTTIYLDEYGAVTSRKEGFDPVWNWTQLLN